MSQGPLCPNLSQKVQKEVSKMANHNLSPVILLGGLSVNLNHLKRKRSILTKLTYWKKGPTQELPNQLVLQTGHRNTLAKSVP